MVLKRVVVCGSGAVSPAGWGVPALREAIAARATIPNKEICQPGCTRALQVRGVPTPPTPPSYARHARLRRSSPVSRYAVAAALEALGSEAVGFTNGDRRLGLILCTMCGCVNYSRRFYDETLKDPATASPLVFPETVFNAPASHLAALLEIDAIYYTLVGDAGTFLEGLALGAGWLSAGQVDGCLVVGAEELDWLTANAAALFDRQAILSEGAAALYLRLRQPRDGEVVLQTITDSHPFTHRQTRAQAARLARDQIGKADASQLLCDGLQGAARTDRAEAAAWDDWRGPRTSPKRILGEGLTAAAAWQCVTAVDALAHDGHRAAIVSVVGGNQQAIAAQFEIYANRPA